MIKVNGIILEPTIFPDGTSQIWHLPKFIMDSEELDIDWRFEEEREIMDLFSLRALKPVVPIKLYIPYLPYGRQDKPIANDATFNLQVFLKLLKCLNPSSVTTLDAHNAKVCRKILPYVFENIDPYSIQKRIIDKIKPGTLVFPDAGAKERYRHEFPSQLVFRKLREPATGKIISHEIVAESVWDPNAEIFLILDDICDGGATFIGIAKELRKLFGRPKIYLFTTHGIYSRGIKALKQAGITPITTNSLTKNEKKKGVVKI